jgi:hypothetical protein
MSLLNWDESLEGQKSNPPKDYDNPLEASYWHLLEIPFHTALQKVKG